MPITRMDVVTMAPKSQEVTTYKVAQHERPMNEQMQLGTQLSKELKHNSMQPVKATRSDNPEYRYDAKEKGNNSYQGKKKNQKKKRNTSKESEQKETKTSVTEPPHLDILI